MNLLSFHYDVKEVTEKTSAIYKATLRQSPRIHDGNFSQIEPIDLQNLFNEYNHLFFNGWLTELIAERADGPLTFRLGPKMTRAGGKTIQTRIRLRSGDRKVHYQIAIASRLLFMTFREVHRPVTVCGLVCLDRLQALQRIMEHEMLHLCEMLTWGKSSCKARRFKTLARNIFGHPDTKHDLVTPRETAALQHAIRLGGRVQFTFAGNDLVGRVNRIHRRATVLVETKAGSRYTDGKRYQKYYIPIPMLRPISDCDRSD